MHTPRVESHGVDTHSSFCLKPSRGSGVAFGSRAPYGAGRLRRRPRFARHRASRGGLKSADSTYESSSVDRASQPGEAGQAGHVGMPCWQATPFGFMFMHVPAPAAIRTYVYACLNSNMVSAAIWTYVYACVCAAGDLVLRFSIAGRRGAV